MTKRGRVIGVVVVAVLLAGAGLLAYRRITHDPYGPGTSHRVEITFDPPGVGRCENPHDMFLHGWLWSVAGPIPDSWGPASVPGTLHVDTGHTATFTSDAGVKVPMTGGKGMFSKLPCSIR